MDETEFVRRTGIVAQREAKRRIKIRGIVQNRRLGALANNTKWAEFFSMMIEAAIPLEIKVNDDEHGWCPK